MGVSSDLADRDVELGMTLGLLLAGLSSDEVLAAAHLLGLKHPYSSCCNVSCKGSFGPSQNGHLLWLRMQILDPRLIHNDCMLRTVT